MESPGGLENSLKALLEDEEEEEEEEEEEKDCGLRGRDKDKDPCGGGGGGGQAVPRGCADSGILALARR